MEKGRKGVLVCASAAKHIRVQRRHYPASDSPLPELQAS